MNVKIFGQESLVRTFASTPEKCAAEATTPGQAGYVVSSTQVGNGGEHRYEYRFFQRTETGIVWKQTEVEVR